MTNAPLARMLAVGFLSGVLLAGCGGPTHVTVRGSVKREGQPLKLADTTYVTITFSPAEVEGKDRPRSGYPAKFTHADASYTVTVPTGKYRVAAVIAEPGGQAFTSPVDKSKTYDLQKDEKIDLDLGK